MEIKVVSLSRTELMKELGISPHTVKYLRELGILKAIRIGHGWQYPVHLVQEFLTDYNGLDVSTRMNAIEAKEIVKSRKKEIDNEELELFKSFLRWSNEAIFK